MGSYPDSTVINEARRRGIPIYPPHVNSSDPEYVAERTGIRVPLDPINGFGAAMASRIRANRQRLGPYQSREEFLDRVPTPKRIEDIPSVAGALECLEDYQWGLIQDAYNA